MLELTATELRLVTYLVAQRHRTVSQTQILAAVWGYGDHDPNLVEVYISSLRRKLEAHGSCTPCAAWATPCARRHDPPTPPSHDGPHGDDWHGDKLARQRFARRRFAQPHHPASRRGSRVARPRTPLAAGRQTRRGTGGFAADPAGADQHHGDPHVAGGSRITLVADTTAITAVQDQLRWVTAAGPLQCR